MTKLVCGVGVNDADYVVQPTVRGVKISCPIYAIWFQMLQRCYTRYGRIHNPTYSENTVCNDWLLFSNYRLWYISNHENGLDVDKDILIKGNKVYSPQTCVFVPRYINNLILCKGSNKGQYPIGVHLEKETGKYKSQARVNGKYKNLGRYSSPMEAHQAWQRQKISNILEGVDLYYKENYFNMDVADALLMRVRDLQSDIASGIETVTL